jgi:hypothetical protein
VRNEWDALDGAHPDAMADAALPELPVADVERSADREPAFPARVVLSQWVLPAGPASVEEPCTLALVRSAERSCAVEAALVQQVSPEQLQPEREAVPAAEAAQIPGPEEQRFQPSFRFAQPLGEAQPDEAQGLTTVA